MQRDSEEPSPPSSRLANRITKAAEHGQRVFCDIGRTIGRTAASAQELLSDPELRRSTPRCKANERQRCTLLCRKGRILLVHEASRGIKEIQQKVGNAAGNLGRSLQQGAGTIQRGIVSGPRQLQEALERVRHRVNAARYISLLEIHGNLTVDVQIAEKLYEDSPQEIRSRLWAALVQNPSLGPISVQPIPDVSILVGTDLRQTRMQENDHRCSVEASSSMHTDAEGNSNADGVDEEVDGWEFVDSPFAARPERDGASQSGAPCSVSMEHLLEAMSTVEWPLDDAISEDSNYGILIQITIGQDEIDEIIRRDIHRTFPELPHFNLPEKRTALFNILKAYSLHDLEVGYCQGMGFVAGILLLYLPEEWAFRMLCQLMNEKHVNLRRFYVPGLEPLKMELWKLERLLEKHLPVLWNHLKEHCISAVLYASQWFLTCFSCPFTENFAARVMDVMMQEKSCVALLRMAFAVLAQMGEDILQLDNFEDILTHIKVKPLSWNLRTVRSVFSASLSSPITEEDVRSAEQEYLLASTSESSSTVRGDAVSERDDLPSNNVNEEEVMLQMQPGQADLQMMMSMDLLLDVDVPEQDPIAGEKQKME